MCDGAKERNVKDEKVAELRKKLSFFLVKVLNVNKFNKNFHKHSLLIPIPYLTFI